jgi:hypothetical protein
MKLMAIFFIMIGGTSRDYLLGIPYADYDFVTDATPEQEKAFLARRLNISFAKFGSIKVMEGKTEIDITTFRLEGPYLDHRHPTPSRSSKIRKKTISVATSRSMRFISPRKARFWITVGAKRTSKRASFVLSATPKPGSKKIPYGFCGPNVSPKSWASHRTQKQSRHRKTSAASFHPQPRKSEDGTP